MKTCYWYDNFGNCWTYDDVVNYWKNLGYDYATGNYGYPEAQEQVQMALPKTNEFSIHFNDILVLATQYWWLGAIFLVGLITLGVVGFRIAKKNKWASELIKMWSGK